MFDRVFKRKEDAAYAEISRRKSKIDQKAGRAGERFQTAPSSISMPSSQTSLPMKASEKRRSLQDGLLLYRELQKRPEFFGGIKTPPITESPTLARAASTTQASRPSIGRATSSASSASYELRNPFRSNTNESITTVSMCNSTASDSLADMTPPVERTVPTYYPQRTNGNSDAQPQKAAIFTSSRLYAQATSGMHADGSSSESGSPSSSSIKSSRSQRTERPLSPPKRHQWALLKSPKHESKDFLQVHIPSGVMSPPMPGAHRHFWSSKT